MSGSFTQVVKTFAPKFERQSEFLEGSAFDVVQSLVERFKQNKLI
jgi:electron transfer flavoprotein beta subunit